MQYKSRWAEHWRRWTAMGRGPLTRLTTLVSLPERGKPCVHQYGLAATAQLIALVTDELPEVLRCLRPSPASALGFDQQRLMQHLTSHLSQVPVFDGGSKAVYPWITLKKVIAA